MKTMRNPPGTDPVSRFCSFQNINLRSENLLMDEPESSIRLECEEAWIRNIFGELHLPTHEQFPCTSTSDVQFLRKESGECGDLAATVNPQQREESTQLNHHPLHHHLLIIVAHSHSSSHVIRSFKIIVNSLVFPILHPAL
ncbi:hypothetical protein KC19_11G066700 [Ceratodon purpureus]|uniref:Uncharacterized protein n=1 Tax=Ceratodon purpureus TaxID=3225 RepID=A0A8T0GD07_CERPU|nr:hypothetical protein KC19_11G066700 [Ceratodon purpureus]